jgi:hypothetical protein
VLLAEKAIKTVVRTIENRLTLGFKGLPPLGYLYSFKNTPHLRPGQSSNTGTNIAIVAQWLTLAARKRNNRGVLRLAMITVEYPRPLVYCIITIIWCSWL